jgi:hypothetical protein
MYKKVMSSWTTVDLGAAKTPLLAMAIGDADNDHQFEVYALGQNNHIFQFKAASVLSPTITPTPTTNITDFFGSDKRLKVFHSQINPTKGEKARIRWYQPNDAGVNLVIYNLLGDKIITLANNRSFAAGQIYEIDWDGRTSRGAMAGSGIYIVLLQAGEYQARAKVAVVK